MEYCEKIVESFTIRTLNDMQVHFGSDMPIELRLFVLSNIAEGLEYLPGQGLVHGDIKPQNVLVSGQTDEEYIFKITDYCGVSSKSSSLRQFMTPGYLAPELIGDNGSCRKSTKPSDARGVTHVLTVGQSATAVSLDRAKLHLDLCLR